MNTRTRKPPTAVLPRPAGALRALADDAAARADEAEERRRERLAELIEKGDEMALHSRASEAVRAVTIRARDDELLSMVAHRGVRAARAALRRAAEAQSTQPGDWQAAVDVDEALSALERAETRASRFGGTVGIYGPGSSHSLFRDLYASHATIPNRDALERLAMHHESRVYRSGIGVSTSFVPAAGFDIEAYADIPRAERVLAALVPSRPLGPGGTIKVPTFSASGSVAPVGQNVAPSETDIADAFAVSTVAFFGSLFTVSRQLFDQSWQPTFDEAAVEVLTAAYDADLESQMFSGSGSSGQLLGLLNVSGGTSATYTDSTPTASKMLASIGQLIAQVADARDQLPEAVFMRPARWAWLASGTDSSSRPFLTLGEPVDAKTPGGSSPVGSIYGIPVYATAGIPADLGTGTNQDAVVVATPSDMRLYADGIKFDALDDVATDAAGLSVIITGHGSAAFIPHRRPESVGTLTGTGLVVGAGY
jgi:hypothetical protein